MDKDTRRQFRRELRELLEKYQVEICFEPGPEEILVVTQDDQRVVQVPGFRLDAYELKCQYPEG